MWVCMCMCLCVCAQYLDGYSFQTWWDSILIRFKLRDEAYRVCRAGVGGVAQE